MILDLNSFFREFIDETYCIIKPDEQLPDYRMGSDIDIFCYDIDVFANIILDIGNQYIDKDIEIIIENLVGQMHIDFIHKDSSNIEYRFDLYGKLPSYQNILIKPAFFESVLENRVSVKMTDSYNIFIPCPIDNNILRYIEYHEWYDKRPDKIKHINYILEHISIREENKKFLEKVHHYTEIPLVEAVYPIKNKGEIRIKGNIFKFIKDILIKILPKRFKLFLKRFI